jgi:hypothetical protein
MLRMFDARNHDNPEIAVAAKLAFSTFGAEDIDRLIVALDTNEVNWKSRRNVPWSNA